MISVVIPVYNAEKYIEEALASVMAQTRAADEILFVDDGSTDGSASRPRPPCARYIGLRHCGIAPTRNQGVQAARGEFLGFLDADDLWAPEKVAAQMAAFEEDPELDMVFGEVEQFLSPELDLEATSRLHLQAAPVPGLLAWSMLIRREAFLRVGLFSEEWQIGEFIDWYARAVDLELKSLVLPQVVLRRRLHTTNSGIVQRSARSDYVKILRRTLERRRAKNPPRPTAGDDSVT